MFAANKLIVTLTRTGLFALAFAASIAGAGAAPSLMTPIMGAKNVSSQFDIKSEPTPIMLNRAALAKLKIQDEFEFALPNATRQIIIFDRIEDHGGGIRSSVGYLKDHGKDFRVIITSGPSGSFGSIRTPDTIYRIIPGPSGQDLLVNMTEEQKFIAFIDLGNDVRRIPEDVNQQANTDAILSNLTRPDYKTAEPGITLATPSPQSTIDLMIVYTSGLAARLGTGLMTRLYNLVTAANTAYIDSEVAMTVRLVNATMVNSSDSDSNNVALDAITPALRNNVMGGVGVFANIENIRNANGADLVAYLRNGDDFGGSGVAWLTTTAVPSANFLYSVTTGCVVGCDTVFIHELGHNMGNAHDRATAAFQEGGIASPPAGAKSYSFGHFYCESGVLTCNPNLPPASGGCTTQPACSVPNVNNIGTIMSYFNPVTLKFSNPNVMCSQPTGVAQPMGVPQPCGVANEADNARSMNEMRDAFANVKATVVGTPGAIQFKQISYTAVETAGSINIAVSRIGGSVGAISVNYATVDGSAKAGFDFIATSGTLTWASGDSTDKNITLSIINDGVIEGGEFFNVVLSNPTGTGGVFLGFPSTASVLINENTAWPPDGTFPAGFTTGVWTVDNNAANCATGNVPCLSSPMVQSLDNSQSTFANADLDYLGNFPAGILSFTYRVSTLETSFGFLEFMVDGIVVFQSAGGETGWLAASVPLSAGMHTLKWRFKNRLNFPCDGQPRAGCADRAWIDNVVLPVFVASSSTAVISSANPATAGQPVTFTATASGASGNPSGVMTFRTGGSLIANCNLVPMTGGGAQCTTSSLATGSNFITADYSGNVTYDVSSSATLSQMINNPSASAPGSPTNVAAIGGNAQATITFTAPASNGSTITGYTATCNPGTLTGTATTSPVTVTNLVNDTTYSCFVIATNGVGPGAASASVNVTPSASTTPVLINVVSRKTHTGIGPFDVLIDTMPAVPGAITVEPRTIGSGHTIVFRFNNAITDVGNIAVADSTTAAVSATAVASGNDVIVTIPALADNKRVTLTLTGVNGSVNLAPISMGFLVGDVNNSRAVNSGDISGVKARLNATTTTLNFRFDVNASGIINTSDVSAVKARSGLVLP